MYRPTITSYQDMEIDWGLEDAALLGTGRWTPLSHTILWEVEWQKISLSLMVFSSALVVVALRVFTLSVSVRGGLHLSHAYIG